MIRLDDSKNQVIIGRWEEITAGGCHLNEKEKEPSQVIHFIFRELGQRIPNIYSFSKKKK